MLFTTIGQYRVFLWMLAAGAAMGAWYALMAALRRLLCAGLWLGLLTDAAFGLGAAALFCLALYTANYGEVRFFVVIAAALGFALFALGAFSTGARIVCAISRQLCHFVAKFGENRWIKVIFK